jgi:hypothetical protein
MGRHVTEYKYRLVSRCVPGSKQYAWHVERAREERTIFTNEWREYDEYRTEAACKGIITRLTKRRFYDGEIEWAIQRQPINPNWEFI